MNGGRQKWIDEGRPLTQERPNYPAVTYTASGPNLSIRAFRQEVADHIQAHKPLIDVRSPGEYSGELLHMPDYPQEGALRGGHIPGAASVPWGQSVAPNGTFKSADELKALYEGRAGLKAQDDVVVYCRIGERSSHTWFVLTYLLGYPHVRNYDGSWTEWAIWWVPQSRRRHKRKSAVDSQEGELLAVVSGHSTSGAVRRTEKPWQNGSKLLRLEK